MKTREELAAEIYRRTLELIGEEGGWDYLDADEQAHDLAVFDIYAAVIAENSATNHRTTPEMRARTRELATPPRDDFDRAVLMLLDDLDELTARSAA